MKAAAGLLILCLAVVASDARIFRSARAVTTLGSTYGSVVSGGPRVTTFNNGHVSTIGGPRVTTFGTNNLNTVGLGGTNRVGNSHFSSVGPNSAIHNRVTTLGGSGIGGPRNTVITSHVSNFHG